jgi:aminopeptidase N
MAGFHNLTRAEALRRAQLLTVDAYDIDLDLTDGAGHPGEGTFACRTAVTFRCTEPGADTFIEVAAQRIRSATRNGEPVDLTDWSPTDGLPLVGLDAHNVLVVEADFEYCPFDAGLHRAVDPADGEVYVYTQFQPADAQRVFACFDQPDLKARFTWQVTIPAHWRAVSTASVAATGPGLGGARTVHFEPSVVMSTYVTALCAGPYHEVRREHDGIDLGLYCRQSLVDFLDADFLFEVTGQGFDHYHAQFGYRYPLREYNQVFIPEYGGAMEHFGCVTYDDSRVLARTPPTDARRQRTAMVMLHEMAHMWFGDLVTMRWWDDLWLNESFATWASAWTQAEATRFAPTAWPSFLGQWKADGYEGDQLSSTHPVVADMSDVDDVSVNFDRITYGKGAAVLKQLVATVGIDAFTAGLRAYFHRHAYGNSTLDDLLVALAETSGADLREFAGQWLQTAGVSRLRLDTAQTADGRYASVAIRQEPGSGQPVLRTHQLAIGAFDLAGDALLRRGRYPVRVSGEHTEVPELAGVPVADLLLLNDDDLAYAKIRLDDRSVRTVLDHLRGVPEPLARALCWSLLWDMVRDADLSTQEYLPVVASALPAESDQGLLATTLTQAGTALRWYADPAWAPHGWALLAGAARGVLDATGAGTLPGGGPQQIWAAAFITAARTEPDLSRLDGWLREEDVPAGLALTADLRWAVLQQLVAFGRAGSAQIGAELARDRTTGGEQGAATARALLPSAEAKALAWSLIMDKAAPVHLRRAALAGFGHDAHRDLVEPYRAAYFGALDEAWADWEAPMARAFASLAYPSNLAGPPTLAAADAWLRDRPPSSLRRIVADRRDDTARAVAAQTCDRMWQPR